MLDSESKNHPKPLAPLRGPEETPPEGGRDRYGLDEDRSLEKRLKKERKKLKKDRLRPREGRDVKEEARREGREAREGREEGREEAKKKEKGGASRGIETMFRTSYRQHVDLSSLADTKSNIMISINGIIISIIIASISPKIDANPWLLIPTTVLLVSCLVSMVYAILSARPRVSSTPITLDDVRQRRANILFFGNFVNLSREDYMQGMGELLQDTDQLYQQMMQDIYYLGHVLARKFRLLRLSYTIFMGGLVVGVALFILVFMVVALSAPGSTVAAPGNPGP